MHEWLSYDDVAEAYERVHAPRFARVAHDLVAMAKPPSGGRVLDVGTGTAVAAEAAREAVGTGGNAVGIDPSVGMLHAGRTARPAVRLAAASGVDLPFADATFDAVTGNFVISHFPSYETGLADMARVVKPGGRIAVSSWADNGDDLQEAWGALVKDAVAEEMLQGV